MRQSVHCIREERLISLRFFLKGKDKHIPKPQRRGAIIILGMLALSKRGILTDKVDVLLKVGLGHLGKVSVLQEFKSQSSAHNRRHRRTRH